MLLTEEQARTKWCPHARVVEVGDDELHGPFNRYHLDADATFSGIAKCIASECMAWRWLNRHEQGAQDGGFCGIAGKVEG